MRPEGRSWRKNGRKDTRRDQEPTLDYERDHATTRQQRQAEQAEADALAARQAHIDGTP